jgi:dTDP-4-amino-4,6-dideoxygalactose transaminase
VAGLPCRMEPILDLARRRRLTVIDDAAHALGAAIDGRAVGSIADMTCFSFYATKNLTTGEGGMVTTADARLSARIRRLSLHGLSRDAWKRYARGGAWRYDVVEVGYKYNMTDVAAALGLAQLAKFADMQKRRARIAKRYREQLADCDSFEAPVDEPNSTHAWHLYVMRLKPGVLRVGRDRVIELLRRADIGTSVHFLPLHLFSHYRRAFGFRRGDFPHTERESARAISLPLHPGLSRAHQDRVVGALREIDRRFRR